MLNQIFSFYIYIYTFIPNFKNQFLLHEQKKLKKVIKKKKKNWHSLRDATRQETFNESDEF